VKAGPKGAALAADLKVSSTLKGDLSTAILLATAPRESRADLEALATRHRAAARDRANPAALRATYEALLLAGKTPDEAAVETGRVHDCSKRTVLRWKGRAWK